MMCESVKNPSSESVSARLYWCNCYKASIPPDVDDEEGKELDTYARANVHVWSSCDQKSLYSPFFTTYARKYFSFLKQHLLYVQDNQDCKCYWPYISKLACEISDYSIVELLSENDSLDNVKLVFPEVGDLIDNWNTVNSREKGKLLGTIIGKYGVDFCLFAGTAQAIKAYRNLKKANNFMTLKHMNNAMKKGKLIKISS